MILDFLISCEFPLISVVKEDVAVCSFKYKDSSNKY